MELRQNHGQTKTMTYKTHFSFAVFVAVIFFGLGGQPSSAFSDPDRWKNMGWAQTDFSKSSIDLKEILSGGPPKDGIPSIDKPEFTNLADVKDINAKEPVITVSINGDARAYPIRVLIWHEIVNDTVGGTPLAVTFCPLCNSSVVFDRRVGDKLLDFGTTGLLRKSNLVMYDRQTESWWQQFTGKSIVGSMLNTSLALIPSRVESFEKFKQRFPKGKILIPNNVSMRRYGTNPYESYDTMPRPFLFSGELPTDISPMARVIVFEAGGKKQAVAMKLLNERKKLKVSNVTLSWSAGQNSALDTRRIDQGRDVGNVVVQQDSADGLQDIVYDITFAFVIKAFSPDVKIQQN